MLVSYNVACAYLLAKLEDRLHLNCPGLILNPFRIVDGFPEDDGSYREFLFSLPRFANDEVCMV